MPITAVIFDLGKVICPFSHHLICERLADFSPLSAEEIYRLVFAGGLEREFDRGKIAPHSFYQEVACLIKAEISLNDFHQIWVDTFSIDEAVVQIYRELKSYRRYLLSNTNQWHYFHLIEKYPLLKEFDGYALSFEVGETKPHAAIFRHVLTISGLAANACLYIDDIAAYVEVARKLGFFGIHFKGADALRQELIRLGIKLTG